MKPEQARAVTQRIADAVRAGTPPWRRPWKEGSLPICRPLQWDSKPYRGVNTINLWLAADARGFDSPYWMTYHRAAELKAHVRKGAKSELSFYANRISVRDEESEDGKRGIYLLKAYPVFNACEIEGLPDRYRADREAVTTLTPGSRSAKAEEMIAATGAVILHGGDKAFYRPSADEIHLPPWESFESAESYYSTALHELGHWTGAPSRLDRKGGFFGSESYAAEELVAELASAYCLADLGISSPDAPRADHAAYIANWLQALDSDDRWIFRQAAAAERAAEYIEGEEVAADPSIPSPHTSPAIIAEQISAPAPI